MSSIASGAAWTFGGEIGTEIDLIGEEFGSGALFDGFVDVDDPLDETTETLRFRDESTRTSGLLRLRLDRSGDRWLRARATVKSSIDRNRADLELAGGLRGRLGDLSLTERLHAQGGEDDPGGGFLNQVTGEWRSPLLPGRLRVRATGSQSTSRAAADSLGRLFDYEIWRPSLELARSFGWSGQARVRGGVTVREAESASSYDALWVELGGAVGLWNRLSVDLRAEGRTYEDADSLSPSYHENELRVQGELGLGSGFQGRLEAELRTLAYSVDSAIYRDHGSGDLALRVRRNLSRGSDDDDLLGLDLLAPSWRVEAGTRYAFLRHPEPRPEDYDAVSLLIGLARDGVSSTWFDCTGELGRRTYREEAESLDFVFEGFNLSLAGTNYTFVRTSLVGEVALLWNLDLSIFAQYEREYHSDDADDFTLWILTASLTRSF